MERFIRDDRTGLDYELVGDCYLIAGEDESASSPLGLWGRRRADYLKQHRRTLYYHRSMSVYYRENMENTAVMRAFLSICSSFDANSPA